MNRYRLFFTDELTRRIHSSIEFQAAHDDEALAYAENRRTTSPMELWTKGGLIKRWESISAGD